MNLIPLAHESSGAADRTSWTLLTGRVRVDDTSTSPWVSDDAAPVTFDSRFRQYALGVVAWFVLAAVGAIYAWAARHAMYPDGISYLDLAAAFLRGEWTLAINRLWSPLYPLLLAVSMRALNPAPSDEFAAVHLVNFVIFLMALASFEFFLSQLVSYRHRFAAGAASKGRVALPEWSLRIVGYTVFASSSLEMISVAGVSPDLCVAACVYLASGLLLKISMRPEGTVPFLLLGVVLGLGYLAKAPMLPLGLVFLALAAAVVYTRLSVSGVVRRLLAALVPFALITGSLVMAFVLTGRGVTVGESATLNYAWHVNGLPYVHWQGEYPGSGRPVHPTREIFASPPVYEFATPIGGTYAPWDDPAYWMDGMRVHLDVKGHLHDLVRSGWMLLGMLVRYQAILVIGGLVLLYLGRRRRAFLLDMLPYSILFIPALAAIGMFSVIWLELRFIGACVTLLWLGLFAPMTFVDSPAVKRVITWATVAMVATLILPTPGKSAALRGLFARQGSDPQWTVAQGLRQFDVHPGDGVAVIRATSGASDAYWALLSGVRIVAELPACRAYAGSACVAGHREGASAFVRADEKTRDHILKILAQTGATAVVIVNEGHLPLHGWRRISDTDYYVYPLRR